MSRLDRLRCTKPVSCCSATRLRRPAQQGSGRPLHGSRQVWPLSLSLAHRSRASAAPKPPSTHRATWPTDVLAPCPPCFPCRCPTLPAEFKLKLGKAGEHPGHRRHLPDADLTRRRHEDDLHPQFATSLHSPSTCPFDDARDGGERGGSHFRCHLAGACSLGNLHLLCTAASDPIRWRCTTATLGTMCTKRNTAFGLTVPQRVM